MTETLVDNDIVVLESHEFELCCDIMMYATGECERPARWAAIKSCCGNATIMCDDCKSHQLSTSDALDCKVCNITHAPAREMFLYVEPLAKGKS